MSRVQSSELRAIASELRRIASTGGGVVEWTFNGKRVRKESVVDLLEEARKLEREADILDGYFGANLTSTQLIWRR